MWTMTAPRSRPIGGAVYYSGFAAANIGHRTAVLPKADMTAGGAAARPLPQAPNVTVYPLPSRASFVTKNVYHTPDRERRTSTVSSMIDPYRAGGDPGGGRRRLASGGTGERATCPMS